MIGNRLMTICMPMPMACRSGPSVAPMSEKVAGSEKQVQERNKNMPAMTAPQWGMSSTSE
jgi:hypothetical protein